MGTYSTFPAFNELTGSFFCFSRRKVLTRGFGFMYKHPAAGNRGGASLTFRVRSSAQSKLRETVGRRTTGLTVFLVEWGLDLEH